MLDNVFETIVIGSNTEFLDIPEKDFFSNYDRLDIESAQSFAEKYFSMREKNGTPYVKDVKIDNSIHRVKIIVDVYKKKDEKIENSFISMSDEI
ncbi:hypothetical protein [Clostridium brassicae]|uniref:Uncharacterized protein n=1 Tax=Clostridium brassicae TaxID=2999072 RepID=A0ABT4DDK8_9CLOT|nr:hypothetical protein [Clostridium brassicae]MCY6959718.1 hypothetical protein [Clostridium brassicae]